MTVNYRAIYRVLAVLVGVIALQQRDSPARAGVPGVARSARQVAVGDLFSSPYPTPTAVPTLSPTACSPSATYCVLYAFVGGKSDGANPVAGLTVVNGNLYGTTSSGGPNPGPYHLPAGSGTVFTVGLTGGERVLHFFGAGSDGATPRAALTSVNGVLYGTTYNGGSANFFVEHSPIGGTIYRIDTAGNERVLHSFAAVDGDGALPGNLNTSTGPLVFVNGLLYGVTQISRAGQFFGPGTIFSVSPQGVERIAYYFKNAPKADAYVPIDLLAVNGIGYGTSLSSTIAPFGGTIYQAGAAGERVLHTFSGAADGASPNGGLVFDSGVLYGTTSGGGTYGSGTAFRFSGGRESVLYNFRGAPDGANPTAGGVIVNGVGYGTTSRGGAYDRGAIFRLTRSGTETVIYSFRGGTDGATPFGALTYINGSLYGTTEYGGNGSCAGGCGTVFSLTLPPAFVITPPPIATPSPSAH